MAVPGSEENIYREIISRPKTGAIKYDLAGLVLGMGFFGYEKMDAGFIKYGLIIIFLCICFLFCQELTSWFQVKKKCEIILPHEREMMEHPVRLYIKSLFFLGFFFIMGYLVAVFLDWVIF